VQTKPSQQGLAIHLPLSSLHESSSSTVGTKLSTIGTKATEGANESIGEAAEGAEDCPEAKGATRGDKAANRAKVQVFMVLESVDC
jgi:hypothetical protein